MVKNKRVAKMPMENLPISVILLAGGRSTRMGQDKAQVTVSGERLVDIAIRELTLQPVAHIAVVSGEKLNGLPAQVLLTSEEPKFGGPVAGIEAGFKALESKGLTKYLAVLSVDAPLAGRLIPQLVEKIQNSEVSAVQVENEPLCMLWEADALAGSIGKIRAERGSTRDTSAWALLRTLPENLKIAIAATGAEKDIDTPEELADFRSR